MDEWFKCPKCGNDSMIATFIGGGPAFVDPESGSADMMCYPEELSYHLVNLRCKCGEIISGFKCPCGKVHDSLEDAEKSAIKDATEDD